MRIRRAVADDALAIATVHVRSWKQAYPGLVPQSFLDALTPSGRLESWREVLAGGQCSGSGVLVLEDDGAESRPVVGFTHFGPAPDEEGVGEVMTLYLDPSAWGRGAGAVLLGAAVEAIASAGANSVTLWVLETNARARRFYERLGWAPDGATKIHDWKAFVATDVRYRFALA